MQMMKNSFIRLLIVLTAWMPFNMAYAGIIGTDQAVTSTSVQDRNAVLGFVGRTDVAGQLQSLGLDAATAKDRVAAMTDEEVRYIAGRIHSMPAGGDAGGVLLIIIIIAIIWWATMK